MALLHMNSTRRDLRFVLYLIILEQLYQVASTLMDRLGVRNVAKQARYFDADIEQAIRLIFTGQCSVF
jgi:hypothetical protein